MKKVKAVKGSYGYIKAQRVRTVIRTILMFAFSLTIFAIGILLTKTKENLLTVAAILGCLPACKSTVNMIMFFKAKSCSEEVYRRVKEYDKKLPSLYDLFFTSYDSNYPISHAVIKETVVCAYSEDEKCSLTSCQKHLETLLKQGGCKNVTVKVYNNLEKYCEGLENLSRLENGETENIIANLLAISL